MSVEENKQIARRLGEEFWNAHNVAAADELVAADIVYRDPSVPDITGREGLKAYAAALFAAYPDLHIEGNDEIGEGDKVVGVWTLRGTHLGPMPVSGMPATGKRIELKGISISRIADGKIVEVNSSYDLLGMLQQVGAMPVPA